jgi:hypothetical protein
MPAKQAPERRPAYRRIAGIAAAAVVACVAPSQSASAYIGASFIGIPGAKGGAREAQFRNWMRVESHYWQNDDFNPFGRRGIGGLRRGRNFYSVPAAPEKGPQGLVIALDKRSPMLGQMMARCKAQTVIPEMTFAESADLARSPIEIGPRPADIPEWFQYRLSAVKITDCPVVPDAPEQAFVMSFQDIAWLNYKGPAEGHAIVLQPPAFAAIPVSGMTKTFVVSWFGVANDVADDQCPRFNPKPSEADYYALMTPEQAAKERAENAKKGGVGYEDGQMEFRGPHKLNAVKLPGIVRDPGILVPQTKFARGLDLDRNDGKGRPPAGICRHANYESRDGRKGIDNQLFTVQGCYTGWQGRKGFYYQYANEQRRNGLISALISISGIDDERNDDEVYVTFLYSKDPMAKNADGSRILADYTFRLTDNPEYTFFNQRLKGRIVDGVIETDLVPEFRLHTGLGGGMTMYDAGVRFEIGPDGFLKGVLGGYQDWRDVMRYNNSSRVETNFNVNANSMYNALRRYADGLKDPATGECNGVSSAYDIEASPAFVPPRQMQQYFTQASPRRGAVR